MLTTDKIYNTYEFIAGKKNAKVGDLYKLGLSSEDVNEMLNFAIIKKYENNNIVIGASKFLRYSKTLVFKNPILNLKVLNYLLSKLPKDKGLLTQLFITYIELDKYDDAFKVLNYIARNETSDYYQRDYLLYMLLLDNITSLPDNYKLYLSTLSFEDIESLDSECDIRVNAARRKIFNLNFIGAQDLIIDMKAGCGKYSLDMVITERLLGKVLLFEQKLMDEVELLLFLEDYDGILDAMNRGFYIRTRMNIIIELAKVLKELESGKVLVPVYIMDNTTTVLENMINTHRFEKALRFIDNKDMKSNPMYRIIYEMLERICKKNKRNMRAKKEKDDIVSAFNSNNIGIIERTVNKRIEKAPAVFKIIAAYITMLYFLDNDLKDYVIDSIEKLGNDNFSNNIEAIGKMAICAYEEGDYVKASLMLKVLELYSNCADVDFSLEYSDMLEDIYRWKNEMGYKGWNYYHLIKHAYGCARGSNYEPYDLIYPNGKNAKNL